MAKVFALTAALLLSAMMMIPAALTLEAAESQRSAKGTPSEGITLSMLR